MSLASLPQNPSGSTARHVMNGHRAVVVPADVRARRHVRARRGWQRRQSDHAHRDHRSRQPCSSQSHCSMHLCVRIFPRPGSRYTLRPPRDDTRALPSKEQRGPTECQLRSGENVGDRTRKTDRARRGRASAAALARSKQAPAGSVNALDSCLCPLASSRLIKPLSVPPPGERPSVMGGRSIRGELD